MKQRILDKGRPGFVPLERALSKLGVTSRTQARRWILSGRIKVENAVVRNPQFLVVPEKVSLKLDDAKISKKACRIFLFYKPRGVVTTAHDEKDRPTVFSFLRDTDLHLHSVGRLDMATTGLLLFTNDPRLSDWLADPKNKIPRTYLVTVSGKVTEAEARQLSLGVFDGGEKLSAESVVLRKTSNRESHLTLVLTEGKNREIRRMFKMVHREVTRLKRVSFGGLTLGDLRPGEFREISLMEIRKIFPQMPSGIGERQ